MRMLLTGEPAANPIVRTLTRPGRNLAYFPALSSGRRSNRPFLAFMGCPKIADVGDAFAHVVEPEVGELDAGFDFFPRNRRRTQWLAA